MGNLNYKPHYRRNLPHIQPPSATLFVTFRLAGSLPRAALDELARLKAQLDKELISLRGAEEQKQLQQQFQRQQFVRLEKYLDDAGTGPTWLRQAPIAQLVADGMRRRDAVAYQLEAYCVMPNHVHTVFTPLPVTPTDTSRYHSLASIMQALKGGTAYEANRLLGRTGQFWEHESYDHYVRDEKELERIILYVLGNPVKAGLTTDWQSWPWSYCRTPL